MELPPLPPYSESALRDRGLGDKALLAVRLVCGCLRDAGDSVVQDTGSDRYDDATSRGQLRWRRARNQAVELLEAEEISGLEEIEADVTDNALQIPVDGTRLSFYSARDGIEHPDLSGGKRTKRTVVNEMQLQLKIAAPDQPPVRLVLLYAVDEDGLVRVAAGHLNSERSWAWQVLVYERDAESDIKGPDEKALTPHDQLPEPELPEFEAQDEKPDERDSEGRGELGS